MKEKKPNNFQAAVYLANTHGNDITEDKLIEIAKILEYNPKILVKNYKSVVSINKFTNEWKNNKPSTVIKF
jgi:hypothetical protein